MSIPETFLAIKNDLPPLPKNAKTTYEKLWFDPNDHATPRRLALFKRANCVENILVTCKAIADRMEKPDQELSAEKRLEQQLDTLRYEPFAREGWDCMVTSTDAAMRVASKKLKANFPANYQVLIVGSGPHGVTAAVAVKKARPDAQVLVVERAESPMMADNFGATGAFFAGNSRNSADTSVNSADALGTGFGGINPIGGVMSVARVTGELFPPACCFQEVATVNGSESGADFVFGANATNISANKVGAGARYKVQLLDRDSGKTLFTNADFVLLCTGLGDPTFTSKDAATRALVGKELNLFRSLSTMGMAAVKDKLTGPDGDPGIRTVRDHFYLKNFRDNADSIFYTTKADDDKAKGSKVPYYRLAVLGGGNSAETLLELVFRQGPKGAFDSPYSVASAQQGTSSRVLWLTGEDGPSSCEDFLRKTRARYGKLAGPLGARPGKDPKVRVQNAYALTIEGKKGDYTVGLSGSTVISSSSRRPNKIRAAYIIVATGYKSQTLGLLDTSLLKGDSATPRDELRLERSQFVQTVRDQNATPAQKLAKRVVNEAIFLLGPAAGDKQGDLIDNVPVGIRQNLAGLAGTIPLTIGAAQGIAAELGDTYPRQDVSTATDIVLQSGEGDSSATFRAPKSWVRPTAGTETVILAALNERLLKAPLEGEGKAVSLRFTRGANADEITLQMTGMSQATADKIASALAEDDAISAELNAYVRRGSNLEITYPRDKQTPYLDIAGAKLTT